MKYNSPAALYTMRMYRDIRLELTRARTKFPSNRHQTVVLGEEFGELCKALLDHSYGEGTAREVWDEAVQVAAMAIRVATEGDEAFPYTPQEIEKEK